VVPSEDLQISQAEVGTLGIFLRYKEALKPYVSMRLNTPSFEDTRGTRLEFWLVKYPGSTS
jgi:hypothetical protein